ncbi:hypothetical protein CEXT_264101 [Caerostris extrusa]|uniref:Uncharacterized protein n=1 Tax=Caerostris extrusa TaxID=172846 RepID=A0AAV4PAY4_CAEEX|nr:hypothetical protein CEXT_264101 [Caerostris extrusa]
MNRADTVNPSFQTSPSPCINSVTPSQRYASGEPVNCRDTDTDANSGTCHRPPKAGQHAIQLAPSVEWELSIEKGIGHDFIDCIDDGMINLEISSLGLNSF